MTVNEPEVTTFAAPVQPSTPFSREIILDEAIKLLEEHGSIGFRLHELAQRLNVTVSALYYHFRNREAIIRAAYLEAFVRDTQANVDLAMAFAQLDLNANGQLVQLRDQVERLRSDSYRRMRLHRMTALTMVAENEAARGEITKALRDTHRATTEAFAAAQRRGLIRADINPEAVALVTRSFLAGLILWDFDDSINVSTDDFVKVVEILMRRLYADDAP
jgi:AcrR family transcriptional regulator